MKCIVTGATGFIGRQLCRQLSARGDHVIPLSKNGGAIEGGSTSVPIDLMKDTPKKEILAGVDVFFHLAGIAHQQAPAAQYRQVNYEATVRLARMAAAAGVSCFIYLSSVKAMGLPDSAGVRTEQDCSTPTDAYSLSKWQAECALRQEFEGSSMSIVILRPALVYAANAKGNLQRLAEGVRRGLPRPPLSGCRSMIALQDLVDLLCIVAENPPRGIHTWIACDTEPYSTRFIYDVLRQQQGKTVGRQWLPLWGWRVAASLLDFVRRDGGDSTFERLFGTEVYSNRAVINATGWQPQHGVEDVFSVNNPVASVS